MKAGIVNSENTSIFRQWQGKHISYVTNNHATTRIVGGDVFYAIRAEAI
jgi:hypothetical protein